VPPVFRPGDDDLASRASFMKMVKNTLPYPTAVKLLLNLMLERPQTLLLFGFTG
jgi:hypothetical protein